MQSSKIMKDLKIRKSGQRGTNIPYSKILYSAIFLQLPMFLEKKAALDNYINIGNSGQLLFSLRERRIASIS